MEIRLLWDIFKQWWGWLALCIAGALAAGILLILVLPKIYWGNATIQLKTTSESALLIKSIPPTSVNLKFIDKDNVLGSLKLFMRNDSLIRRVIRECELEDLVDFPARKFSDPGKLSIAWRKRGVKISAEKDSELFDIRGYSPNRAEAALIANVFVREFFEFYVQMRRQQFFAARDSYQQQLSQLRKAIDAIDAEELAFRQSNNLLSMDTQRATLLAQVKAIEDERYEIESSLASELTEKTGTHPDVVRLQQSMKQNRSRLREIQQQTQAFLVMEHEFKTLQRRRVNLEKLHDEFDAAMNLLRAAEDIDFNHFLLVNEAALDGEDKDYIEMPAVGGILALFLILGIFSGIFVIFVLDYSQDSPRLLASFQSLIPGIPCYTLHGRKGWTRLAAALNHQTDIALFHRGGNRAAIRFTRRLQREFDNLAQAPDVQILPDCRRQAAAYTEAVTHQQILYIVQAGRSPRAEIEADAAYFREHLSEGSLIGVFHHA